MCLKYNKINTIWKISGNISCFIVIKLKFI